MITTVTGKNQVTIPAELARAFNIKAGTRLEWTPEADGALRVKPLPSRGELARRLAGIGRPWLKPDDDPIADLIRERVIEDDQEPGSSC
jgi:AbrB family looped-hinge helix DNA binding protein